jgi:hypothetical protein
MKIQRYSFDKPRDLFAVNDAGAWVRFYDIQHLLPKETPDWEPCEIEVQATHVMNAQGKTFPIDCVPTGCDVVVVWLSPDIPAKFYQMHLSKCCLTPVRRRKVEPVVFTSIVQDTSTGSTWLNSFDALNHLPKGQKVRVTVEVIE